MRENTVPDFDLPTNDPQRSLRFQGFEKLSGDEHICTLCIVSNGFACQRPFYVDSGSLSESLRSLKSMLEMTPGTLRIGTSFEPTFVQLELNDLGHVFVSGEVCEYGEYTQRLEFHFRTDQTVLSPLLRFLTLLVA